MAYNILKHRRGTTQEWQEINLIPEEGELVVEECTDGSQKCKIGNGQSKFLDLPYVGDEIKKTLLTQISEVENNFNSSISSLSVKQAKTATKVEGLETQLKSAQADLEKQVADSSNALETKIASANSANSTLLHDFDTRITALNTQLDTTIENGSIITERVDRLETNLTGISSAVKKNIQPAIDALEQKLEAKTNRLETQHSQEYEELTGIINTNTAELEGKITKCSDNAVVALETKAEELTNNFESKIARAEDTLSNLIEDYSEQQAAALQTTKTDLETCISNSMQYTDTEVAALRDQFQAGDDTLFNELKQLIDSNDARASELLSKLNELRNSFNEKTAELDQADDSLINQIYSVDNVLSDSIKTLSTNVVTLQQKNAETHEVLNKEIDELTRAQCEADTSIIAMLLDYVTKIYTELASLTDNDIKLVSKIFSVENVLTDKIKTLKKLVDNNHIDLKGDLSDTKKELLGEIATAKENLTSALTEVNTNLAERISDAEAEWHSRIVSLQKSLSNQVNGIDRTLSNRIDSVENSLTNGLADVKNSFGEDLLKIENELAGSIETLNKDFDEKLEITKTETNTAITDVHNRIKDLDLDLDKAVSDVGQQINLNNEAIISNKELISAKASELNEKINLVDARVDDTNNELENQSKRISNLIALPEGSTSGDAELVDIRTGYNGLIHESAGDAVRALGYELTEFMDSLPDFIPANAVDGLAYEDNKLCLTSNGKQVGDAVEIVGGGGGGTATYSVRIINEMVSGNLTVAKASSILLSASFYEKFEGVSTSINGTLEVSYSLLSEPDAKNDSDWTFHSAKSVPQEEPFSVDVANVLVTDQNVYIRFKVTGGESGESRILVLSVKQIEASIEAINFDTTATYTSNFEFKYRCIGRNLQKTVYFEIDDKEYISVDVEKSHNVVLTQSIQLIGKYSYGAHSLKVYFKTDTGAKSNILHYTLLYDDGTSTEPMIGVICTQTEITYGDALSCTYVLDTPGQETTDSLTIHVYSYSNQGELITYEKTERTEILNNILYPWQCTTYPDSGLVYIDFTSGKASPKTFVVNIKEAQSEYDNLNQVTTGLVYAYNAIGRSNSDLERASYSYEYVTANGLHTNIEATFDNFNWVSNGYIEEGSENNKRVEALTISGDARHTIKLPIFSTGYKDDLDQYISLENTADASVTTNGRTIEIDFMISNVTDINAPIIECMSSDHAGFVITPQSCCLLYANGENIKYDETGFIENEDTIAAAYLKDNSRIRVAFVIEPKGTIKNTEAKISGQCINIYVNGQFANSLPYPDNANFVQANNISIGSNSCITKIYEVRLYNRGLSTVEILQNYKASPWSIQDRIERFKHNDVLTETFDVDYYKAINRYPCLLITGPLSPYKDAPGKKDKKKTESGVTLTKPDGTGGHSIEFDLLDKDPDGVWYSMNNVQGTSSVKFPVKNYKVYLAKENTKQDGTKERKKVKYALKGKDSSGNELSFGESTLCWKGDFMSSDHANTFNANLADTLFGDVLDSQDPDKGGDSRVQNTIFGFRCLLFQRDDVDEPIKFVGDGALNNDKGNTKSFGLEHSDDTGNNTLKQKWEFKNNTEAICSFKSDRFFEIVNGKKRVLAGLESTYPDQGDLEDEGLEPNYEHIQVLFTWVCQRANFWDASTDLLATPKVYKGKSYNNERDYRKAIFISEFEQHFNKNHALVYYLFCEFTALCDNRAKNMFLRCENVRCERLLNTNGDEISIMDIIEPNTGKVNADLLDWENSTFAKWLTDLYDLDSCFGVENSGYLEIPYYADWNYKLNNTQKFNGLDSRLWLMFEEALAEDIKKRAQELTAKSAENGGLNYEALYQYHIRDNNNFTSAAVINRDMEFKYSDSWANGYVDYETEGNPMKYSSYYKYLQRGSREKQKDAFIFRRSNMLYSKYLCSKFLNNNINFRCGANGGVPVENTGITLTANQVLYPAVKYGDGDAAIVPGPRTAANTPVTITKPGTSTDKVGYSDTVYIAGGSFITDIGDISNFYPYELKLQNAAGLKRLIIGSSADGYENSSLSTDLELYHCPLLEEINIMGCTALPTLNLSSNSLLRKVYSSAKSITLPDGGVLEELHLGSVVDLEVRNQANLTIFDCTDYNSLTRLWIVNTPCIPALDIAINYLPQLTNGLRLEGISASVESESDLDILFSDDALGKAITNDGALSGDSSSYPHITGTCHIPSLSGARYNKLKQCYPKLALTYDELNSQLIFMGVDGKTELCRQSIYNGADGLDPVSSGTIEMPRKESTVEFDYEWVGWTTVENGELNSEVLLNVLGDRVLYPVFKATRRKYWVTLINQDPTQAQNDQVLLRVEVPYGDGLNYLEYIDEPYKLGTTQSSAFEFTGFVPSVDCITSHITSYAQFRLTSSADLDIANFSYSLDTSADTMHITKINIKTNPIVNILDTYQLDRMYTVESIAGFDFYTRLEAIQLPSALKQIRKGCFKNDSSLIEIQLPEQLELIGAEAFCDCERLTSINIPASVSSIGEKAFGNTGIKNIVVDENNTKYKIVDDCLVNLETGFLIQGLLDAENLPQGITIKRLGEYCFRRTNIKLANVPQGIQIIPSNAFSRCGKLYQVDLPDGITELAASCFSGCTNLSTINLPDTITKFGTYALNDCPLESVTIPAVTIEIGDHAFAKSSTKTILKEVIFVENRSSLPKIHPEAFKNNSGVRITVPWSRETKIASTLSSEISVAPWGAQNCTVHYIDGDVYYA
jgi:hypothetical protein